MKTNKLTFYLYILGLHLLLFSCGNEEDTILQTNTSPVIMNQQFDVLEDIGQSKIIGRVNALDADGDILSFKLESDIDLIIEPSTGIVKTTVNSILDYETNTTIRFDVSVKDSNGASAIATITINVLDVYEGPLNSLQKSFLDEYIYVIYQLDYFGKSLSEKWEGEIRIFLDGNITSDYQQMVTASLEEFNSYLTDGTTIRLVNTLEASNVHLIMGPKSLVQPIWPDMFDLIEYIDYIGYALYDRTVRHNICKGRIWVNLSGSRGLFMHELGHIMGLGHSSDTYCGNKESTSFMCSETALEFSPFDREIIKALYHPGTSVLLTQNEMRTLITEYIIENSVLE